MNSPAKRHVPDVQLDGVLGEIAEVAGLQAALAVVERWGGIRLYVPEPDKLRDTHPMVEAVGADAAQAIAQRFQREEILVPRTPTLVRAARDRRIRAEHDPDAGVSASVLAQRWGLSLRMVRYILAETGHGDDLCDAMRRRDDE